MVIPRDVRPADPRSLAAVFRCLNDTDCLLAQNVLQLNKSKSEIGPPNSTSIIHNHLGPLTANVKPAAGNLGVIFNSNLSFDQHIRKGCSVLLSPLTINSHNLYYCTKSSRKVNHAFIFPRLGLVSLLYQAYTIHYVSLLQLVQSGAAGLLTGANRQHHITSHHPVTFLF